MSDMIDSALFALCSLFPEKVKEAKPSTNMLLGKMPFPAPPKVPVMTNTALAHGLGTYTTHTPAGGATPAIMNAPTVAPRRKVAAPAPGVFRRMGQHLMDHEDLHEIAGLGTLALPALDHAQAKIRATAAHDKGPHATEKRQFMGETAHAASELGGLGYLAAGSLAKHKLHKLGGAVLDELQKLGFVSDDEARSSLDRLETLEHNKPTVGQVARYSAIGGAAAPAVNAVKNAIKGRALLEGHGVSGKLRGVAADAVGGAALTGLIPLVRTHLDRRVETKKLHQYLAEHEAAT